MNGKIVVGTLVALIVGVLALAFWWPEGKEEEAATKAAVDAKVEELTRDKDDGHLKVVERQGDGSVVISNRKDGVDQRVAEALKRRDARVAERAAEGNPFGQFLDDGRALTEDAMNQPSMLQMDPSSETYDPSVEAQQRFSAYEEDILALTPLNPDSWREVTVDHQDDIKGVFKRSKELVDAGENEKARLLIEEWSELQNKYKAQAYGRSPQPMGADQ